MAEGSPGDVGELLSQFRCLGTTDRDVLVNELHAILGGQVSREQCLFVLEMSSWNLQNAIGAYYDYLTLPTSLEMRVGGAYIDPPGPITTGKQFSNVWTVINTGTIPWPLGVRLVYCTGFHFDGITEGPIDVVKPNEKLNITVTVNAPSVPGVYRSEWRLTDPDGRHFGDTLSLVIRVIEVGGVADITDQLSTMSTGADPIDQLLPNTDQCTLSPQLVEEQWTQTDDIDHIKIYHGNSN